MLHTKQFRKYPKNTWTLTKLQERHMKIKLEEENNTNQHGGVDDLLSYSRSEQELRKHLINNFDFITSSLELGVTSTSPSSSKTKRHEDAQEIMEARSVSSLPSLASANTSSPSLSLHSNFATDEHHQKEPQFVPEDTHEKY